MAEHGIDIIQALEPSAPGAHGLLIRHAERESIDGSVSVWEAGLTPTGRTNALAFGKALAPFSFGGAFASPIPRCMDTAALILEGWGHGKENVRADWLLLNAYVQDKESVKAQFEVKDSDQLILDHVAGAPLHGFLPIAQGSVHLLSEMTKRMKDGALTLFVSHDALLMPFAAHFLGESFSKSNWFSCLHGAAVWASETGTYINGKKI